jgi:hypothetical protein
MFAALVELLTNPLVLKALLGYWVYSAFVGAWISPEEFSKVIKGPGWQLLYRIVFAFLHGLSGNLNRAAIALKVPGAQEEHNNGS